VNPAIQRPDGDVVEVRVPADVLYVSTLRLAAAALAARCELTIDDIEDLRLAVDEACALLLPHVSPGSTLDARFELAYARLEVQVGIHECRRGASGPHRLRMDRARGARRTRRGAARRRTAHDRPDQAPQG